MNDARKMGRVTIPTDLDVVPQTLEILKKWGADAIRDCDGTDFPAELQGQDAKIYSTYYTTRKDNAWAKANPDEIQQCYIMTDFHTAAGDTLSIPLMKGIPKTGSTTNRPAAWKLQTAKPSTSIPSLSWPISSGTRFICTTPSPTTGKILNTRSPLMYASPEPINSPWSGCGSLLPTIPM